MHRGLAALATLPIPLLGFLVPLAAPEDRLVRYHGLQGGTWTLLGTAAFAVAGMLRTVLGGPAVPVLDAVAALLLVALLVGCGAAVAGALRGRYVRLRPAWDLLARLDAAADTRRGGTHAAGGPERSAAASRSRRP